MDAIQDFLNGPIGSRFVNFIWALLILLIGYVVARIVLGLTRKLLNRFNVDNRLANALSEPGKSKSFPIEDLIAKAVFWVIMIFPIVGAFERLGLNTVAQPLTSFLDQLTTVYLPRIIAALVLVGIAWLIATVLRFLIKRGASLVGLDSKLAASGATDEGDVSVSDSLATAVFWFVFLFFLPGILNALGLNALSAPIQGIFDSILGYIPNVLSAAAFAIIGWFVARIIRNIVINLLMALGVDQYSERLGLSEDRTISGLLGNLLYIFILLIVAIAALDQLNITAISEPAVAMLTGILDMIPNLLSAIAILVLAYFIGRMIANLVRELLTTVEFDTLPGRLGVKWSGSRTPSAWVGSLVLLAIMLFAATSAIEILNFEFLVTAMGLFIGFMWDVLLALIIIALGLYFAGLVYNIVSATGAANAHLLGQLGRIAVIVFSVAIALGQLNIGDDIVSLAFGIMLAAIGFAFALAVGLGSRESAGREVENLLTALRTPPVNEAKAEEATE